MLRVCYKTPASEVNGICGPREDYPQAQKLSGTLDNVQLWPLSGRHAGALTKEMCTKQEGLFLLQVV